MKRRDKERLQNILVPLLLPFSVVLMMVPADWSEGGRNVVLQVTGPMELGMSTVFGGLAALPRRLRDSGHVLKQNVTLGTRVTELQSEVDYLKTQLDDREKLIRQFSDLKRVLPERGYRLLPAHVVRKERVHTATGSSTRQFTIGIGSRAGVRKNDVVVVGYAVVGKITVVSPFVSTVRLVTDTECLFAARSKPNDVEGLLAGYSPQRCLLKYVPARSAIKVGDYVVTSGFKGLHPPRLLLGTVARVTRARQARLLHVEVKPAVNLEQVSQVIVVRRREPPR